MQAACARSVVARCIVATFLSTALSGCLFDEVVCSPPEPDEMGIGYGFRRVDDTEIRYDINCGDVVPSDTVDRYTFVFATPAFGTFDVQPSRDDLASESEGSAIYHVGPDHSVHDHPPEPPYHTIGFTRWDPELNGNLEPLVSLRYHSGQNDSAERLLPMGEYGFRIGLRTGEDAGPWMNRTVYPIGHTTCDADGVCSPRSD